MIRLLYSIDVFHQKLTCLHTIHQLRVGYKDTLKGVQGEKPWHTELVTLVARAETSTHSIRHCLECFSLLAHLKSPQECSEAIQLRN